WLGSWQPGDRPSGPERWSGSASPVRGIGLPLTRLASCRLTRGSHAQWDPARHGTFEEGVMATRALLCPECGATVTAGRLSCLECGALLAAVAGVGRRAMQTVAAPQSPTPAVPLMAAPQVPGPQAPVTPVPMA